VAQAVLLAGTGLGRQDGRGKLFSLLQWSMCSCEPGRCGGIRGCDVPPGLRRMIEGTIRTALEAAGVQFIEENGGGAGVRLLKSG
jgi:hypothetical protein